MAGDRKEDLQPMPGASVGSVHEVIYASDVIREMEEDVLERIRSLSTYTDRHGCLTKDPLLQHHISRPAIHSNGMLQLASLSGSHPTWSFSYPIV